MARYPRNVTTRTATVSGGTPVMEGPHITEDAFAPAAEHLAPGQEVRVAYPSVAPLRERIVEAGPSWESLQAALARVPVTSDAQRAANTLVRNAAGEMVRWVSRHTGETFMQDGRLVLRVEDYPRHVALDRQDAVRASASGVPTDFFNGYTWMRYGYKPERDLVTLAPVAEVRTRYEPASPVDQAIAVAAEQRRQSQQTPIPVIPTLSDRADVPGQSQE